MDTLINTDRLAIPEDVLRRIVEVITSSVDALRIYVFGSYARGEESPVSDVDIYVVLNSLRDNRFKEASRAALDLYNIPYLLKSGFDLVCNTSTEFIRRSTNVNSLEFDVIKEGVPIYDRAS